MATVFSPTGQAFTVPDSMLQSHLDQGFTTGHPDAAAEVDAAPYEGVKVNDLKALIADRNENREGDALLPATGKRETLVATLVADDAAQAPATE